MFCRIKILLEKKGDLSINISQDEQEKSLSSRVLQSLFFKRFGKIFEVISFLLIISMNMAVMTPSADISKKENHQLKL
jgi:hypothetical protein